MMKHTLASVVIALSVGCAADEEPAAVADPHAHHAEHETPEVSAPSGHSIFHLESRWVTHQGEEVSLSSLAGKVQVLAMVYTHCELACPRIMADMRHIRAKLLGHEERVGFVLVSIDPERDTPERLAEFARTSKLADSGWTLLHGDAGAIHELAAVLGVQYRRVSETDFSHSNLISVLNENGEVVHRQLGLGVDPAESVAAIQGLLDAS